MEVMNMSIQPNVTTKVPINDTNQFDDVIDMLKGNIQDQSGELGELLSLLHVSLSSSSDDIVDPNNFTVYYSDTVESEGGSKEEGSKFQVSIAGRPLNEYNDWKGKQVFVRHEQLGNYLNSIVKYINNLVQNANNHLSTIKTSIGDESSGLTHKLTSLKAEFDSFKGEDDIIDPNAII